MDLKLNGPLSENLFKIRRIGVGSVILTYPCMAPSLLPALLPLGGHIADRNNITGAVSSHSVSGQKGPVGGSFIGFSSWVVSRYVEGPGQNMPGWRIPNWEDKQGK